MQLKRWSEGLSTEGRRSGKLERMSRGGARAARRRMLGATSAASRCQLRIGSLLIALLLLGICNFADQHAVGAAQVPGDVVCSNGEITEAATLATKLFGCQVTAAKKGVPVDTTCLNTATGQFTTNFLTIESTGACDATGQAPATRTLIETFVGDMVAILHPNAGRSLCAARQLTAVGKGAKEGAQAWVKYRKTGNAHRITTAALNGKAHLIAHFFNAEILGDCVNNGEGDTIAVQLAQLMSRLVAALSPVVRLPAPTSVGMGGATVVNGTDGTSVYVPPLAFVPGQAAGFSVKAIPIADAVAQVAVAGLQLPARTNLIAAVQLGIGENDPVPLLPAYVSLPEPTGLPSDVIIRYDLAEPTSIAGFADTRSPALHSMGQAERSGGQLTLRIPPKRFGSPPGTILVFSQPCFNECSYHGRICAQGGACPVAGVIALLAVNGMGGCETVEKPDGEYGLEGCFADQISPAQPSLIIHTTDASPNISVVLPDCYASFNSCASVDYDVMIPLPPGTGGAFAGSWSGTFTSTSTSHPGYHGQMTFRVTQSGNTINGTGVILDSFQQSLSGSLSGTVSGPSSSVGVAVVPGFSVNFTAHLGGAGSMSGTYSAFGDAGNWSATRQ